MKNEELFHAALVLIQRKKRLKQLRNMGSPRQLIGKEEKLVKKAAAKWDSLIKKEGLSESQSENILSKALDHEKIMREIIEIMDGNPLAKLLGVLADFGEQWKFGEATVDDHNPGVGELLSNMDIDELESMIRRSTSPILTMKALVYMLTWGTGWVRDVLYMAIKQQKNVVRSSKETFSKREVINILQKILNVAERFENYEEDDAEIDWPANSNPDLN